ncbi:uncharacterized protein C8orf88 homolog [Stegastes partitus]|uniref:Uncharacterized protein C8orf88 homolog n=1 Tax=Stegastes partitus TaxID=144197 RepID=A0A9Y4K263_9TELE|nr:PREDICTED: uncharacterized protein C8orf88 homolog [Stegastes partitus]XP_008283892.1 PREDICTED: uncharacterized protein C8orf88 homolog [Stegastes partitus]
MEVSRRRILQKHLEPARPLRRYVHAEFGDYLPLPEPQINAAACPQTLTNQETNIAIEQFCKIINLHKQQKARISYTRDFLIGLASCPEAKKKPEHLPEHPIVLTEARDPGNLNFHEMRCNGDGEHV